MRQRKLQRFLSMDLNAQGSKEQSVASAVEIQQELEISSKFEVEEDNGWILYGGGDREVSFLYSCTGR